MNRAGLARADPLRPKLAYGQRWTVSGLDPRSTLLADNFDQIVARSASMTIESDLARRREEAATVPNHWGEVATRSSGNAARADNAKVQVL
jgi:hypothetical protein